MEARKGRTSTSMISLLLLLGACVGPDDKPASDGDSAAPDTDTGADSDTDTDSTGDTDTGGDTDSASDTDTARDTDTAPAPVDGDGDGYASIATGGEDCDDGDGAVNPGASEICGNGTDDDCDGGPGACGWQGGSLAGADAWFPGEVADDYAADQVLLGDFDGDGLDDVLVSAPDAVIDGAERGGVYAYTGARYGENSLAAAPVRFVGDGNRPQKLAVGDFDRDGISDLLIGAAHISDWDDRGVAWLISGPVTGEISTGDATLIIQGEGISAELGVADVDGDGWPEAILSSIASENSSGEDGSGRVYALAATSTGTVVPDTSPDVVAILEGDDDDSAGSAVAFGDLDGDGISDSLVGAFRHDTPAETAGCVYVVKGPIAGVSSLTSADAMRTGVSELQRVGSSVAIGDVDGDGWPDVAVGAQNDDTGGESAGAVWIFRGPVTGVDTVASAETMLFGTTDRGTSGYAIAMGDFDGDARADIAVSAHVDDAGGTNAGAAPMFFAPAAGTFTLADADVTWLGGSASDLAGIALSAGDVDGDGLDDLLIGGTQSDAGPGIAWLLYGADRF